VTNYLEVTKIINSAAEAKDLDIFETQLAARKTLLDQITQIDKESYDKKKFRHILDEIENLEKKINLSSEMMKKDILKNQSENKVKISKIKKSSDVSNKYKYAGSSQHRSSYIDQKK